MPCTNPSHRVIQLLPLCLALAGCAAAQAPAALPLDTGYTLQVNRGFAALPNYTRLYFQRGERVNEGDLDRWTTYCWLHVFDRDSDAGYLTAVAPGRLALKQVSMRRRSSDQADHGTGNWAAAAGSIRLSSYRNVMLDWERYNRPSYYSYSVEMRLESPEQPDLRTLTCSRQWSIRGDHYPRLEEIERALGDALSVIGPAS